MAPYTGILFIDWSFFDVLIIPECPQPDIITHPFSVNMPADWSSKIISGTNLFDLISFTTKPPPDEIRTLVNKISQPS